MKPTRDEFVALLKERWNGATIVQADRGLYVIVGSEQVAAAIKLTAQARGYKPVYVEERGPEDFEVRVFGFPR